MKTRKNRLNLCFSNDQKSEIKNRKWNSRNKRQGALEVNDSLHGVQDNVV